MLWLRQWIQGSDKQWGQKDAQPHTSRKGKGQKPLGDVALASVDNADSMTGTWHLASLEIHRWFPNQGLLRTLKAYFFFPLREIFGIWSPARIGWEVSLTNFPRSSDLGSLSIAHIWGSSSDELKDGWCCPASRLQSAFGSDVQSSPELSSYLLQSPPLSSRLLWKENANLSQIANYLPDPASPIHLLVASKKKSIGKCVPARCWHVQGLLLPTTKPRSERAVAVQSSQVQGSSECVCMLTPKPFGEIYLSVLELPLGRPCSLIPDLVDQLGSFVFSALKHYYHYYQHYY